MQKQSERIRNHVTINYIDPARKSRSPQVKVCAGDVHKELALYNAVPSVCQVLRSQKFQKENDLRLVGFEGPPSGLSTTSTFLYELADTASVEPRKSRLDQLWGSGREIFKKYGGGEKYLKAERHSWSKPS